jgi:hypothetical protein
MGLGFRVQDAVLKCSAQVHRYQPVRRAPALLLFLFFASRVHVRHWQEGCQSVSAPVQLHTIYTTYIEYTSVYIVYEHSTARRCAPLAFTRRGRWTQITGNSQSLSWPVDASDAGKTTTLTKQRDLFGGSRHALFAQEVERGFHVSIRLHTEAGGRCDQHQVHRENRTVARRMASSHTRDTRMKPGS